MTEAIAPTIAAPYISTDSEQRPLLESVSVDATISGLVMQSILRQSYINDSEDEIEITYTFPLGSDAVLTHLGVSINGKSLTAHVLPKAKASSDYERAIESGDTPVMVETAKRGLYTANIGNLLPGERIAIELSVAQTLQQTGTQVRVRIPTVIAPNYGDAGLDGGLSPHQVPRTSITAEHGFDLTMTLKGCLASASISSPTHRIKSQQQAGDLRINLTKQAVLDRDFVLVIDDLAPDMGHSLLAPDGKGFMGMLSFTPAFVDAHPRGLNLKILVDCSGSMGGERIAQARRALKSLSENLSEADNISLTVFGSTAHHQIATLTACTPTMMRKTLWPLIDQIDADLGGTEMHEALELTYAIPATGAGNGACDVLLITDGDVWAIDAITASAVASGHRVFALGVGSAPGESLLTDLATYTGGACDLLSAKEDMTQATLRLLKRLRLGQNLALDVDWGGKTTWASKPPKLAVPGETVHLYAQLKTAPAKTPSLHWKAGKASGNASLSAYEACDTVTPLTAARKLRESTNSKAREKLAVHYQLVSDTTNLLLIYEREEEKKAKGQPVLKQIMQMLPKGWGATSYDDESVSASLVVDASMHRASYDLAPRIWHSNRTHATARIDALSSGGMEDFEVPSFLRKSIDQGVVAHDMDPLLKEIGETDAEKPYKLLTTLLSSLVSGLPFEPNLIGRNRALMRIWLACHEDAETPDQAFAIFILALEMLLHPNLAATNGKSIPVSQLNKVRKYGDVKDQGAVIASYEALKAAFPNVTLHRW
jgi:Ca-activated chloride channel family protein